MVERLQIIGSPNVISCDIAFLRGVEESDDAA